MFETQEGLLAYISQMLEARGWQKEWVNISTAGMILVRFKARNGVAFTMSLEDMRKDGEVLPDVSDLYVD